MNKFWNRDRLMLHFGSTLIITAFTAGIVWAGVSGYDARITALEKKQTHNEKTLERMDYNVQIIAKKVGVVPLIPPAPEYDE